MRLLDLFGDRIKKEEPLKKHTNYRIGGPAQYYFEARNADEFAAAFNGAKEDGLNVFILGGGSNILVSDSGIRGLVLVPAMRNISIDGDKIIAEAGAITAAAAKQSADAGLSGLEWAVGIPGTIGGAVRGNAGCYGGEMKDVIVSVDAVSLETGERVTLPREECRFGYRESVFKHEPFAVMAVKFALRPSDRKTCMEKVTESLTKRRASQPVEYSSAGCVFKNFEFASAPELPPMFASLLPPEFIAAHKVAAGWIIDRADLKGKKIGDAMISEKHGNFFVNTGNATADQIIELISLTKTEVRRRFGVQLSEEIQLVGFN